MAGYRLYQVYCYFYQLSGGGVFGLRALGTIANLHGYTLTLLQSLVTFGLNRAVMNRYVFAILW